MSNGKNNAANPRYYHNYTVEFQRHFSGTDPDSKHCSECANECVGSGDGDCQYNSISVFVPCL